MIPLQSQCEDALRECWTNGEFFDAVWGTYSAPVGPDVVALLVFGVVGLALYAYSGRAIVPAILLILIGAVTVTQVPAVAVQVVGIAGLVVVMVIGYLMWSNVRAQT